MAARDSRGRFTSSGTSVNLSGPILNMTGTAALDAMVEGVVADVAHQAYANWMTNLDSSIRQPTPYYETQVTTDINGNEALVHDRGVIYGPWLEGTGSRNNETRFKGYAGARRAAQTTEGQVPALAEASVAKHLAALQ